MSGASRQRLRSRLHRGRAQVGRGASRAVLDAAAELVYSPYRHRAAAMLAPYLRLDPATAPVSAGLVETAQLYAVAAHPDTGDRALRWARYAHDAAGTLDPADPTTTRLRSGAVEALAVVLYEAGLPVEAVMVVHHWLYPDRHPDWYRASHPDAAVRPEATVVQARLCLAGYLHQHGRCDHAITLSRQVWAGSMQHGFDLPGFGAGVMLAAMLNACRRHPEAQHVAQAIREQYQPLPAAVARRLSTVHPADETAQAHTSRYHPTDPGQPHRPGGPNHPHPDQPTPNRSAQRRYLPPVRHRAEATVGDPTR